MLSFYLCSEIWNDILKAYSEVRNLSFLFGLGINKIYKISEISDFLVFGAKNNVVSEVRTNIFTTKKLLGVDNYD